MVPSSLHLTCKDVRLGENLYSNQADLDSFFLCERLAECGCSHCPHDVSRIVL